MVKARPAPPNDSNIGSHVMEYGERHSVKSQIYFLPSSSSRLLLIFMHFVLPNLSANNVSSRFQYEQLNVGSEEKQRALTSQGGQRNRAEQEASGHQYRFHREARLRIRQGAFGARGC